MKKLIWFTSNGAMLAVLIAGISGWAPGLAVFGFWTWFLFVLYAIVVFTGYKPEKPLEIAVPKWADVVYDILVISILAGASHGFLAVIYLIAMLMQHAIVVRSHTK